MNYISNVLFGVLLITGIGYFVNNIQKLVRNIKLGKSINRNDNKLQRFKNMAMIALGQSKMVKRPFSGFLHIIVYVGFVIINIEVLEIVVDGLLGTHRVFQPYLGDAFYGFLIGVFEVLAALVFIAVVFFWLRRNLANIKRFLSKEMTGWPKRDGNLILYFEMVLMSLFIIMNATDTAFQEAGVGNIISQFVAPIFEVYTPETIHAIERTAWWIHIIGILVFLNYLFYSKHLHILLFRRSICIARRRCRRGSSSKIWGFGCCRFKLGSIAKCIYMYGMWSLYICLSRKPYRKRIVSKEHYDENKRSFGRSW